MTYPNETECECPRCRRHFMFRWAWETRDLDRRRGEDGEVVTEAPAINGSRVAYEGRVACPMCGTPLRVSHWLEPEFYATVDGMGGKEGDIDGEGQD